MYLLLWKEKETPTPKPQKRNTKEMGKSSSTLHSADLYMQIQLNGYYKLYQIEQKNE